MAIAVNATKEALASAYVTLGAYISLHTSDPSTTGQNEAAGGTPSYARKQTTWTAGASDGIINGSEVSIDVPAGSYTHAGIWSAATGGNFIDKVSITATTLGAQGVVKVTPTVTVS